MAARWGAGDGTLTIGGMELFTAAGSLQCHDLEEDETCDSLADLALSSLDAGGILGTFQGYIDNSIISIIEDPAAQAEKGLYDDENELSLLTALTEILDNADDENLSPFDSIPDSELLVSPKDRDGSAKLFALSRTPPDHDMFSLDGQRRATPSKISGPNWELFPDTICSTPKKRIQRKSLLACLPRRAEVEETQQRSDGEDEELLCVVKSPGLLTYDNNMPVNNGDPEPILMQGTPCIINTENFALSDLVKYMHPYCLPAISMCLESEDDENLLKEEVFLEIVSDQGECIKVPVVVEPPAEMLCPEPPDDGMTGMDVQMENLPNHLSSPEKDVPELEMIDEKVNDDIEKVNDYVEKADEVHDELTEAVTVVPKLQDSPPQPPMTDIMGNTSPGDDDPHKSEEVVPVLKNNNEPDIATPVVVHDKPPQKVRKSSRAKKSSKSKSKSKTKIGAEDKPPDAPEPIPMQSVVQPPTSRPTNPSLQESDFLIKTLDQVTKESQMDLRTSKTGRTRTRTRASMDAPNAEKKVVVEKVKPVSKEGEQAKSVVDVGKDLEQNPKVEELAGSAETGESATKVEILQSDKENVKDVLVTSDICGGEESGASKVVVDVQDGDSSQMKEAKPKSLSLSEYRKRLQHRQPNPARDHENLSCSKWPTVPEPPTELAELPCLIVPVQSKKPSEEKACPQRKAGISGQDVPVSSVSIPAPMVSQEVHHLTYLCPTGTDVAPPAMMTPQPNVPPPFYPPVWPTVPPHPSFYPGMPPMATVPHYPNMPSVLPVQPPPVMNWPPFPPPPIAVPPVHPTGWIPGPPMPYWPNPQMAQGMPENQYLHNAPEKSVPIGASSHHVPPVQKGRKESVVPAVGHIPQAYRIPVMKPENNVGPKGSKNGAKPECPKFDSSSLSMEAAKSPNVPIPEAKNENILNPDVKSANQVVFKIMEILKKAQKLGFQIKPTSNVTVANLQPGIQVSPSSATALDPPQTVPADVKVQVVDKPPTQETPAPVPDGSSKAGKTKIEKLPATGRGAAQIVASVAAEPGVLPPAEPVCTSAESFQTTAKSDLKEPEKSFTCESGIEATDLTSLLEQFEKSEAKEEERLPQSPDKLAVGNSGTEKTLEKKILEKHLAPELASTAGLTPPATPPHQLWKSVVTGSVTGISKSFHGPEKTSSPLKTAKLIEPKPLPQSRLKSRSLGPSPSVAVPPVHVASGDHDYCILSIQPAESHATAAPSPASCEEGSRWNVKHHPNITIKPIVQFNKWQQHKACPKPPAPSAPSAVANQSTTCGPVKPIAPCVGIQKASTDPLDHRTNAMADLAVAGAPGSVLMSPDSSPCRSEIGESRTDVKRGDASSRRSLRCYRKYKGSPSPQKSWRDRSSSSRSGSRSSSSSSSTSRSRSGSPASKRRRTSRYRSRTRHRSRSSSRSSYGTSGSSRSSSCSSRSCTPSSSRSRSRSRSPYKRRCRSRTRRCESRESYNRRKMIHKERAIEERRVVYIGKINSLMTRSELRGRFSVFGDIEECTIHFREKGDNYGFVTYRCTREAFAAIENGHKVRLPGELPFDLCFGGRRQFCKSNYADLDSNRDDFDPAPVRSKFEALDFDTLLKQAQKDHRR